MYMRRNRNEKKGEESKQVACLRPVYIFTYNGNDHVYAHCVSQDYSKLITALCQEKSVPLITVPSMETLGEWAGLCKIDAEGVPKKKMKCACVVVTVRVFVAYSHGRTRSRIACTRAYVCDI